MSKPDQLRVGEPPPEREEEIALFEEEAFVDGFNWTTILGAVFVGMIMLPGAIYMGLVTGQSLGGAAQWVTIILFVEVAKRSFVRLRRQEIIILYAVAASLIAMGPRLGAQVTLFGGPFGQLIWDQYLVQSPQAESFGIAHLIPPWIAPQAGSESLLLRSFVHRDWLIPILILCFHNVAYRVCLLSAGYVLYRITNDIERLPFPLAPVYAGGATALAESSTKTETWRWRVFSIGAMIGIVFGAIYTVVPISTGAVLSRPLTILPIPFIDLTRKVGTVLPAAVFGLWTDLSFVFLGFVLPFPIVLGTFISAMLVGLVLNPILYKAGILHTWRQGMTAIPTLMANRIDLWISVSIGMALVIALIGLWSVVRALFAQRGGSGPASDGPDLRGRGDISLALAAGIWGVTTLAYILLCHMLVPTFPLWLLLLFGLLWSPFVSYIRARMIGITGSPQGATFPFIREGCFVLSGYRGVDIWFAPVPFFDFGLQAQAFKQFELTRTKFVSTVKATFATLVIVLFFSFIYWSAIWKLAPVPSSTYPYVQKMWPYFAWYKCLWASSTIGEGRRFLLEALKLKYIMAGFGVASVLYGGTILLGIPTGFFYGLVSGLSYWVHRAIPTMAGALLSRYYLAPRIGRKRWKAYTPVLLAGYSCGMGLITMFAVAVALIAKAVSQLVF